MISKQQKEFNKLCEKYYFKVEICPDFEEIGIKLKKQFSDRFYILSAYKYNVKIIKNNKIFTFKFSDSISNFSENKIFETWESLYSVFMDLNFLEIEDINSFCDYIDLYYDKDLENCHDLYKSYKFMKELKNNLLKLFTERELDLIGESLQNIDEGDF